MELVFITIGLNFEIISKEFKNIQVIDYRRILGRARVLGEKSVTYELFVV